MVCPRCKKESPNEAKYCSWCGRKLESEPRRRRRRPQSQGTITKLGGDRKNKYWARLPADYSTGVPVRKSVGCFPTYSAAAEALTKAMYIPEEAKREEKPITLGDVYERFISSNYYLSLSPSAQGSHRSAWKHMSACAMTPISEINRDTFQEQINAMHMAGLKRETLAKVRNLSSLLCKEAMAMGLLSINYGQLIQLPKADSDPVKPFSTDEIRKIWLAAEGGDEDAMAVLILIYTGMRPSELLGVKIEEHLHCEDPYWYFRTGSKTKAGRNRIIPIPAILRSVVGQLIQYRTSGPLIVTEQGKHFRLDNWRPRHFNPLMDRMGLTGFIPYSCRHTFSDILKRKNTTPDMVMTIMGHSDYSVAVEHYFSTTDEDIARICAAVDGLERPP